MTRVGRVRFEPARRSLFLGCQATRVAIALEQSHDVLQNELVMIAKYPIADYWNPGAVILP